jgi:hypothetical protein
MKIPKGSINIIENNAIVINKEGIVFMFSKFYPK